MRTPEEIYRLSPAEEDEDPLYLIGTIAVRWATLDATLIKVLGHLLRGNDHAADVIYSSLANFKAKMDIIQNLATETLEDEAYREALIGLLGRISNLADARNEFIHLRMVSREKDSLLQRWRRKPGRKKPFQLIPVNKNDLIEHAKMLVQLSLQINMLIHPRLRESIDTALEQHEASPETPK